MPSAAALDCRVQPAHFSPQADWGYQAEIGKGSVVAHFAQLVSRELQLIKDDGRNPHGTTAVGVGAIATSGGTVTGDLVVQPGTLFVLAPGILYVGAATTFFGTVDFRGPGGEGGYIVDRFINRSGVTLRTGDIVKLKGTPIVRFEGDLNKSPIPEVTLADRENDSAVVGIVDLEAIPHLDEPDTRSASEDPTAIPDGGDLLVVTLGSYAHCKVDATETPIEVGDLLTSSAHPGYTRKATDPKIGSIIGQALEPLKESTSYIAVFVNLQ